MSEKRRFKAGYLSLLAGFVGLLIGPSCTQSGSASFLQRTNAQAKDHIMLVRQEPPTFGFRRLVALSDYYPDLPVFLKSKGLPGFMAETSRGGNRYLILYYTEIREQFAVRSGDGASRQVEFSGPYPITEKEIKALGKLRQGGNTATMQKNHGFP
ncbi:MAG: hypothetical protein AB8D78_10820 [Akkermansiaceae bacterium]